MVLCPICKKSHPPACGLRLFNSENECPICLEKQDHMIALPCGHQFCQKDLEKLGGCPKPAAPAARPVARPAARPVARPVARPKLVPLAFIQRHIQNRLRPRRQTILLRRRVIEKRRCGWCGHIGHTQRKCPSHRPQCGCSSYNTRQHKKIYKTKTKCTACFKKGHRFRTCTNVVKGLAGIL